MTLLFGNITVELDVFHTSFQPPVMDDHEEVSMIDILVSHTFEESCYNDPLEKYLTYFGQKFDIDESIEVINTLFDSVPVIQTNQWKIKVEFLPVSISIPILLIIESPKLELKPLPDTLKYVFLSNSET